MKRDLSIFDVNGLSVRARNAFNNNLCETVGDAIAALKTRRCLKFRNFGRMSFNHAAQVFGLTQRFEDERRPRCAACGQLLPTKK